MSTRSVKVVLEAEVNQYLTNVKKAEKAASEAGKAAEDAGKKIDQAQEQAAKATDKSSESNKKHSESGKESAKGSEESANASKKDAEYKAKQRDAAETAGGALTKFGAVSVAALGASAKAAMDWESAWAGVTKTVDGTPEQMSEIESGLRGLAKTLPSTHTEIAAVAEAAGQLGVKREDILKFTKTMIDLGETTNLTAEEAATDIAQIANVMGTTGDDIDNFGATLVALGNDGASTEKEILSMAQRIAGAGKLVGASEADVLALANTLASMGVKAELGGGVATRALLKVYGAVKDGGPALEAFAKTAGVSSEDFAKAFSTSPVAALEMFTKGLGRVKDEGGNVVQALRDVGMKGTEELQVMLALAGAGDLLSDSLKLGSQAWEENTALIVEATKRYDTTESKVKVAWNNIKDAAIDAGAVLLPVISNVAESVSGLAQTFGSLPGPVKGAITGIGGVAGAAALAGGGLMLLLPKVRDGIGAFKDLDTKADGSSRGLGKFAKAAGIAAGAALGFEIIKSIHNSMQEADKSTEQFTQSLIGLGKNKDSLDNMFRDIGVKEFEGDIGSAGQALKKLTQQDFNSAIESFGATNLGVNNGMAKLADAFVKTDQAIAGAATSGNLAIAANGFKSVAASAKEQGIEVSEVAKRFPNYLDALRSLASQSKVNVSETELLDWAMGKVPAAMEAAAAGGDKAAAALIDTGGAAAQAAAVAEEVVKALEEVGMAADGSITDIQAWTAVLFAAGLLSLNASDAAIAYQASIDAMTESVIKNGTTLDINTEQGRNNQTAYNNIAKAAMGAMTATAEETLATQGSSAAQAELQKNLGQSYKDLITAAGQLGITGDAADTLARKALGIPKETPIESWVNDKASSVLDGIRGKADQLNGKQVFMDVWATTHETTLKKTIEDPGGMGSSIGGRENGSLRGGLAAGGEVRGYAGGGDIYGPGTSTSDEVLIWASPGEHMLDKGDVDKMGGQQGVYKFRANLRAGQFDGLAGGGGVGNTAGVASRSVASTSIAQPVFSLEGMTVVGQMELNADATWAKFRGVARQEAAGAVTGADAESKYMRPGRR